MQLFDVRLPSAKPTYSNKTSESAATTNIEVASTINFVIAVLRIIAGPDPLTLSSDGEFMPKTLRPVNVSFRASRQLLWLSIHAG